MQAVAVQSYRFLLAPGIVTADACGSSETEGWMKWPHRNAGQKENHMPFPPTPEPTFPQTGEHSLQQLTSFEQWRALASAWPLKQLVSLWNDLPGVVPVQKFTNR